MLNKVSLNLSALQQRTFHLSWAWGLAGMALTQMQLCLSVWYVSPHSPWTGGYLGLVFFITEGSRASQTTEEHLRPLLLSCPVIVYWAEQGHGEREGKIRRWKSMRGVCVCWDEDCFRKRYCHYYTGTVCQQDSNPGRQPVRAPCSLQNFSISSFISLQARHPLLTMDAEHPGGVNMVP